MFFMADSVTFWRGELEAMAHDSYGTWIEPFTLMCALAQHTRHLGLTCTSTTTYDQPYSLARRFASLDLVSGGRAGWNLVTSGNVSEADSFGLDEHMEKVDALSPRARVRACGARAVEQLGRGRVPARQGIERLFRQDEAARARAQGRVLPRARAAQRAAVAAGRAGDGAGRRVGGRPRARRRDRRGGVRRACVAGERAGILCRREGPHAGLRPRSGFAQDHAGAVRVDRADARRGAGEIRPAAGADRSDHRVAASVQAAALRSHRPRHRRAAARDPAQQGGVARASSC